MTHRPEGARLEQRRHAAPTAQRAAGGGDVGSCRVRSQTAQTSCGILSLRLVTVASHATTRRVHLGAIGGRQASNRATRHAQPPQLLRCSAPTLLPPLPHCQPAHSRRRKVFR